jgi:hypothetical protein
MRPLAKVSPVRPTATTGRRRPLAPQNGVAMRHARALVTNTTIWPARGAVVHVEYTDRSNV